MLKKILLCTLVASIALSSSLMAQEISKNKNLSVSSVYTQDKTNIVVTAEDPTFTLKLKSNPTTGYSWFLRDYDPDLLTPVSHHFEKSDKTVIGAPGFDVWTFHVKPAAFTVPQQTMLRMIYSRPWQGDDNSTQVIFRVMTQGKTE